MILVTGCGRSGTAFAAQLLQGLGLDVGHEKEGKDGTSNWRKVVAKDLSKYNRKIHLVRRLRPFVSSFLTAGEKSWDLIGKHVMLTRDRVRDSIAYWVKWNQLAEDICDFRVTLNQLILFARFADLPSGKVNSRKHGQVALADLEKVGHVYEQARVMEARYFSSK